MKPLLENWIHLFTGNGREVCRGLGGVTGKKLIGNLNWAFVARCLINVLKTADRITHLLISLHFYLHRAHFTEHWLTVNPILPMSICLTAGAKERRVLEQHCIKHFNTSCSCVEMLNVFPPLHYDPYTMCTESTLRIMLCLFDTYILDSGIWMNVSSICNSGMSIFWLSIFFACICRFTFHRTSKSRCELANRSVNIAQLQIFQKSLKQMF